MPIKEVTMYIAQCPDDDWQSNPHETIKEAQDALDYHEVNDERHAKENADVKPEE